MPLKSSEKDKTPKVTRVYVKKPSELLQNRMIKTRVTQAEEQEIKEKAEQNKMSIAAYLRYKVLEKEENDEHELLNWKKLGNLARELIDIKRESLEEEPLREDLVEVLNKTIEVVQLLRSKQ